MPTYLRPSSVDIPALMHSLTCSVSDSFGLLPSAAGLSSSAIAPPRSLIKPTIAARKRVSTISSASTSATNLGPVDPRHDLGVGPLDLEAAVEDADDGDVRPVLVRAEHGRDLVDVDRNRRVPDFREAVFTLVLDDALELDEHGILLSHLELLRGCGHTSSGHRCKPP